MRRDNETELVGGTTENIHASMVPGMIANLLEEAGKGRRVAFEIQPESRPATAKYQVRWQFLTYDHVEEHWVPVHTHENKHDGVVAWLRRSFKQLSSLIESKVMPTFDVDQEKINVFEVNDTYLFKHYFENDEVFDELGRYYNQDAYRFELPDRTTLQQVDELLGEYFHTLNLVSDIEPYCVVVERGEDYSDILRNAVVQFDRGRRIVFLMKDKLSADQAIEQDATPLEEAEISNLL
ncbi:MAG: hypothetical protein SV186_02455 [Candidatus Nanohaloarchaea archaeon]|nr:hypothetical protein [Candidatus Nanohaloarchaea archaeon]